MSIDEIKEKLANQTLESRPFRFLHLPLVVLRNTAEMMGPNERISLAMTSRITEKVLIRLKLSKAGPHMICLNGPQMDIWFPQASDEFPHKTVIPCAKGIQYNVIFNWLNIDQTPLQNFRAMYKRSSQLIPGTKLALHIEHATKPAIKRIFMAPEFEEWTDLVIKGNHHPDALRFILDRYNKHKNLIFSYTVEFPLNFQHEKAFQLSSAECCDARWIRRTDILAMHGVQKIKLGRNLLTHEDIREVMKYMVDSEKPPCQDFELYLGEDQKLRTEQEDEQPILNLFHHIMFFTKNLVLLVISKNPGVSNMASIQHNQNKLRIQMDNGSKAMDEARGIMIMAQKKAELDLKMKNLAVNSTEYRELAKQWNQIILAMRESQVEVYNDGRLASENPSLLNGFDVVKPFQGVL